MSLAPEIFVEPFLCQVSQTGLVRKIKLLKFLLLVPDPTVRVIEMV